MTSNEIEVILNSNIPNYLKSLLLHDIFEKNHEGARMMKEGGKTEDEKGKLLESALKKALEQNPNFVQRLMDPASPVMWLGDLMVGTHKLVYVELDGKAIVIPLIYADENGELHDTTQTGEDAYDRAIRDNDYVVMGIDEAKAWTADNYKKLFPKKEGYIVLLPEVKITAYKKGGSVKHLRPTETIQIGDKEFDVEIADTAEKRMDGLSRCKSLKEDEGMLFVFDKLSRDYFTMKETDIDLDICFIGEDGVVISVESVEARDPNPVVCEKPYKFVFETVIDSDILPGDELDQEDEDLSEEEKQQIGRSKMLVLNSDGDVQMKLVGGERIVSMIKTRQLIKAALKAYKTDNDSDYRRVGKIIINELDALDGRDPQYVDK